MGKVMKFRKKPVVIEAIQFNGSNLDEILQWGDANDTCMSGTRYGVTIGTLEGNMTASIGDWVIKGGKGEFYPCKPDIFAATYEVAE